MAESSKLDFKRSKVVVGVCAMKKKASNNSPLPVSLRLTFCLSDVIDLML